MKKSIYINEELHKELKIEATKQSRSLYELIEEILLDYHGNRHNKDKKEV